MINRKQIGFTWIVLQLVGSVLLIVIIQYIIEPIWRRLFWPIAFHCQASNDSGNLPCMWIAGGESWVRNGRWGCSPPIPNYRERKKLRELLAVGRLLMIAFAMAVCNGQWLITLGCVTLYSWTYRRAYQVGGFHVVYHEHASGIEGEK